jgi:hypothetical protein
MSGVEIILLCGVIGLWLLIIGVVGAGLQMRKTLVEMEKTLREVQSELSEVSPRVQSLLDESSLTTAELRNTLGEVGRRVAGMGGSDQKSSTVVMALKFLPVAIGLVKGLLPLLKRRHRGEREE